ncbi:hypothetical protein [Rhodococcus sp. NPDC047139]|uniref:hypothetical protein n=1 Tax=Rhodococcus sp. NPDC047139 TaxID=3155141 RepID=UPI0033F7CA74
MSWDLTAGRNLLIQRDERRSSPSVSLDLIAMTVLTCDTHELVVVDPHRRHHWLGEPAAIPSSSCSWAATAEQIACAVTGLDTPLAGRRRVLLVADLAATVAALGVEGGKRLAAIASEASERQVLLVATAAETDPRWYPAGLIDAFDDIVARPRGRRSTRRSL